MVSAWRERAAANGYNNPVLVLVGGYAGSGQTEFARFLGDVSKHGLPQVEDEAPRCAGEQAVPVRDGTH